MNEPTTIEACLLEFLSKGVFSEEIRVTVDTDLVENGFDSLSLVSLLVFIERTYGLWIPQNEINETNLKNIGAMAAMVLRRLNEGASSS